MKKYIAPEMAVSLFDNESIVTLVSGKTSAFDKAMSTFDRKSGSVDMSDMEPIAHTFVVDLSK